jgi:hypothetical protein
MAEQILVVVAVLVDMTIQTSIQMVGMAAPVL